MADKSMILSAEAEAALLKPIDEYVGKIQKQIDALRVDGSDKVRSLKNHIAIAKEDKNLTKEERAKIIAKDKADLEKAKSVESANKDKVSKLISDAESYLSKHYKSDYYEKVVASCEAEKAAENASYDKIVATIKTEHEQALAKLSDSEEIKDEKYVYRNRLFDAQMTHESKLQEIKDRKHDAFAHKFHLIDLLRMSKYTFGQKQSQKVENYKYTFNTTQFLYKNGLYIVILLIFIALCIITPIVKHTQLLTLTNILNILQQASPRMFLALGVAGLILLTGTDLSIGRMVGMGMVTATIIMHSGVNTGGVFGHIFARPYLHHPASNRRYNPLCNPTLSSENVLPAQWQEKRLLMKGYGRYSALPPTPSLQQTLKYEDEGYIGHLQSDKTIHGGPIHTVRPYAILHRS